MDIDGLARVMEEVASLAWAEDWDNCGVLLRSRSGRVDRIAVALDPTAEIVRSASSAGCDCLVTHHPLIFSPLRRLDPSIPSNAAIFDLIEKDMSILCCHTSWDNSPAGTNVSLANSIGLGSVEPMLFENRGWGVGAVGRLEPRSFRTLALSAKDRWRLSFARLHGDPNRTISKVALCGGSGGSLWRDALAAGAEVYITADVKYHDVQDAVASGLSVLEVDHGEMEWASMGDLAAHVGRLSGLNTLLLERPSCSGELV